MTSHDGAPRRVKVQGDLFHGRVPDGAIYIGRAAPGLAASKYANPFKVKVYGAEAAVEMYRQHLDAHPELAEAARQDLADRDAACWCPEPAAGEPDLCHGRPLLDAVAAPRATS
jgi:hypothetical protein